MSQRIDALRAREPWRSLLAAVRREVKAIADEQFHDVPAKPFKASALQWYGGHVAKPKKKPNSWSRGPYRERADGV